MNKYLIFRTDRVGDFLISAIFLKCIKLNDPDSHITVVASKKNYSYIKSFPIVDSVIELQNNITNKIKLIYNLKKKNFNSIIVHDDKKRSRFISVFLNYDKKIIIENKDDYSHIELIKIILKKMNFTFFEESLNIFTNQRESINSDNQYSQLHFDEKWVYKTYIKKFLNIEPSEDQLISFISDLIKKTNNKLIITTGADTPKILKDIIPQITRLNVKIYENLDFLKLERLTSRSKVLISCHGAISHIAAANKIKQIDIIDKSYNYGRWTEHFRSYNYLYRDNFIQLSKKIMDKL